MFHLLATTKKSKRQQIAILIISFFAYVAGIRNEGNNMLLLQQQQQTTIEDSNYQSSKNDAKQQQTSLNFRPSQIIDFTIADAAIPQKFKSIYTVQQNSTNSSNNSNINDDNNNNKIQLKQATQIVNRRYTFETAGTYGIAAKKQFSFPNEQQQIPQHLTDKPIYIYRDPYTNENYHYTPTEMNVKDSTTAAAYNNNNNNNNIAYQQQISQQHDNNQEYLVQSSMIVGSHQHQHNQHSNNPLTYMSLSNDKDVYLKRPGFVYDEKTSNYVHPNSVIDKNNEETHTKKSIKISYDSHDYPPPSYFQQQTSNFLPTPVPKQTSTPKTEIRPTPIPTITTFTRQDYRPSTQSTFFAQQRPQQQYLQSSQSTLSNYANSIDNYLPNKQQTSEFYRAEQRPPPLYLQQHQQQQQQLHYENRPPAFQYVSRPQSLPPPYEQYHQYFSQTPSYPQFASPPPPSSSRPSYNNYYDYQIGEIPPQAPSIQQFNYPYPRPPANYPYQGPNRPPPQPQQQQQNGLATLAQYAPQFTSLILNSIGGGVNGANAGSNTNGPLSSLIGALTGATNIQQSSSSSSSLSTSTADGSYNRRPVNSQLIRALENIARNDDLQCVPKVLCQMIAAQTQRGQLPTFITSPAITNFLAGFPAASPALIYGRALLLGLSGGEKSCHQTYVKCPKTEYEIIYYLNNHRGGFFKFFSEPEEQQQPVNNDVTQQSPTTLFSFLAALTGTPEVTTTTARPTPEPQRPSTDITGSIGNFFTQLLSDYMGGATVEYQRRFKRRTKRSVEDKIKFEGESEENHKDFIKFQDENRENQQDKLKFKNKYQDNVDYEYEEDFHDEEDDEDTQQGVSFQYDDQDQIDETQGRILQKPSVKGPRINFFPQVREETATEEIYKNDELKQILKLFDDFNRGRKFKFPTDTDKREYIDAASHSVLRKGKKLNDLTNNEVNYGNQFTNFVESAYDDLQSKTKRFNVKFKNEEGYNENHTKTRVVFPNRKSKILNHPSYAASYLGNYQEDEKFIVFNNQRPETSLANLYNTHINSVQSQNNFNSNAATNNNIYHFLPTTPQSHYDDSNLNYPSKDYINLNVVKQSSNSKLHTNIISSTNPSVISNHFDKTSQTNLNQYHSSFYTTRSPVVTTPRSGDKNIYVTNSRGVTEYYITPDGRKVYLQ